MIGALMPGHAATGSSPGLPGTVRFEDRTHPSTEHLPQRWDRADEWYNYSANVRGDAHVLATMDESTYDPGGNAMGYDHPISWCKYYDGGRAWMTGMGHFGAHYTGEPELVQHIVGGVQWAAGLAAGRLRRHRLGPVREGLAGHQHERAVRRSTWRRTAGSSSPSWCAGRSGCSTRGRRPPLPP